MKITWKAALAASTILCGAAAPAFAQEAAPSAPASEQTAQDGVADIVVTARRRAESLQKVPIAITVVDTNQLQQAGAKSTEDLRQLSPSLNISGQSRTNASFYIRGQGPGVIQAGLRSFTSVATYFAEVPTTISGPTTFYDLANVQVLKGPQGTLFGRNTTGGAVLFEPQAPRDELGVSFQASYGNHDYKELQATLNLPLKEDLAALRIAGIASSRDGYTKSVVTGQKLDGRNFVAVRASLKLTPGPIENLTIVDYGNADNSGSSEILRDINPGAALGSVATPAALAPLLGLPAGTSVSIPLRAGGTVPVACLSAALPGCPTGAFGNAVAGFQAAYNGGNFANPANGGFSLIAPTSTLLNTLAQQRAIGSRKSLIPTFLYLYYKNIGVTNKTQIQLADDIVLKNIIGFRQIKRAEATDYDGTGLNTLLVTNLPDPGIAGLPNRKYLQGSQQFNEEFQIQGNIPDLKLNYIAGYYHEVGKPGFDQILPSRQFGSASYVTPDTHDKSDALFAHFEWQLADFIGVSGGIRRTWDKRRVTSSTRNGAGVCTQVDPVTRGITCPISYKASFGALTYDGTINLTPTRGLLIYGAYRRGYKSGGFTLPAPAGFQTFKPEFVDDFEVGLKGDWNVGFPVRANIAGFYDKYKDIQTSTAALVGGNISTVIQNIGKQTNKGVEAEVAAVPVHGLNLSGYFSYLSAKSDVSILSPAGVPAAVKGRQVGFQPRYKYGVRAEWTLPVHPGGNGDIVASANYAWQAKVNTADVLAPINSNPSYGLLNARLEWRNIFQDGVDLAVFATNLTDKRYILGGYQLYTSLGFDSVLYGEPRMYGVTLRFHTGD